MVPEPDPRLAGLLGLEEADESIRAAAVAELDRKTKPRGSLGRLEDIAAQVAAIRGSLRPDALRAAIVVAAADHGIAAEGVSAYPQEVTRQMVANFAAGGAAVCVLADAGITAVGVGEMGIGNTTSAAALAAALLGGDPIELSGPGTGLDAEGVVHKAAVVGRMLERNRPDPADPLGVLAAVGGFEIGVLVGVALGAATGHSVVVLDGFITGAAALVGRRLAPALGGFLVASHRSAEPGHRLVLEALGLVPLLELDLRLGEGSGAALALPIVAAARDVLVEMATFSNAGVTDTGR